ncbi:MAG: zf-HC2 domain-containing protein [Solirubrobacteraceae bacterium]
MDPPTSAVTARGVIDGQPSALEALARLRGPSVLAYCERVAAPGDGLLAAAEAFRGFRSAAIAAADPFAINPEELLIGHTRRSAAAFAPAAPPTRSRRRAAICANVPAMLAAEAGGTLGVLDRERLRRHLSRCVSCREAKAAQLAGERAYRHGAPAEVAASDRAVLFAALASPGVQLMNGSDPPATALHEVVPTASPWPEPTPATTEPAPEPAALAPGPPPTPPEPEPAAPADTAFESAPELAGETAPEADPEVDSEASVLALHSAHSAPPRGGLGTRLLAPAAVMLAGIVIVLAIAGVFNGSARHQAAAPTVVITPNAAPAVPLPAAAPSAPATNLHVPHGGPLAPALPPGTSFPDVKARPHRSAASKAAPHRSTRAPSASVPSRSRIPSPTAAPRPAPATPTPAPAAPAPTPKSTAHELGSPGAAAPPPQTGTVPAAGGFQPSN